MEISYECNQHLFMLFIDYKQKYDSTYITSLE